MPGPRILRLLPRPHAPPARPLASLPPPLWRQGRSLPVFEKTATETLRLASVYCMQYVLHASTR